MVSAPRSEAELLERCQALAGRRLGEVAEFLHWPVPGSTVSGKGWAGQLLEAMLGATAGSRPAPDFVTLRIELKTVPLRANGRPAESTYVCSVPLADQGSRHWRESTVYHKLAKVLWFPVEAHRDIPLAMRRIGTARLWRMTPAAETTLRSDWEELMEMVETGQVAHIDARYGTWLQIRPKARNASVRTQGIGARGERIRTNPRGFYLRSEFTTMVLAGEL